MDCQGTYCRQSHNCTHRHGILEMCRMFYTVPSLICVHFIFRSLVLPVLRYSYKTWTLTGELRRILNYFVTMSLRRILGYQWHDYMSHNLVLSEAGLRIHLHSSEAPNTPLWAYGATPCGESRPSDCVCLGDGQTEAEGLPSQDGRDDALLRRMPPNMT